MPKQEQETPMTAPLVPAEVDLRDFAYMPVDIVRLFGSEFHALANDSEWRAGVTLWLKSFHQVPAASLPGDDVALARLAEFGRDVKGWKKVRERALRGWVLASDGRLYHPVVAEKALEAWIERLRQRKASGAGNVKRWGGSFDPAEIDAQIETASGMLARLNPLSRALRKGMPRGSQNSPSGSPDGSPGGTPKSVPPRSQEKLSEAKLKLASTVEPEPATSSAAESSQLARLRSRIVRAFEVANSPNIPDTSQAQVWLAQRYDPDIIVAVIASKLASKPSISKLSYFDDAIAEAHERRPSSRPVPLAKPPTDPEKLRIGWMVLARAHFAGRWQDGWEQPKPGQPGFPEDIAAEAARECGVAWPPARAA